MSEKGGTKWAGKAGKAGRAKARFNAKKRNYWKGAAKAAAASSAVLF